MFRVFAFFSAFLHPIFGRNLEGCGFKNGLSFVKNGIFYVFQINERIVDFTSATSMPEVPKGLVALWGIFLGWLGDRHFVLNILQA